jgi:phospholipase C
MLGHLSYEDINPQVDGLKKPINQYVNYYKGDAYTAFNMPYDTMLPFDIPHEYNDVATQLALSQVTQKYTMTGFVEAYTKVTDVNPNPQTEPMGFFNSTQVPITSFLARTFCTCYRWFASLPTSTQPNRTIAFTGNSSIYKTGPQLIQIDDNIFDWMNRAGVRWRVYHDGLSFFALYPKLTHYVLGDQFRDYKYLYSDMLQESPDTAPQIIIVEPSYQDGPHIGADHPNDNHAPLAIGWGEDFLRRTYEAITANPNRWDNTVMVTYYDEHGGFYDHVPPPPVPYKTTGDEAFQFNSLGPRIPGIIISPLVQPGSVCHSIFDHTSVLQFLAEKFTPGSPYSSAVDQRSRELPGIASLSVALTNDSQWQAPLPPSQAINVTSALGNTIPVAPTGGMAQAFELAAQQLIANNPEVISAKHPELIQWKNTIAKVRK